MPPESATFLSLVSELSVLEKSAKVGQLGLLDGATLQVVSRYQPVRIAVRYRSAGGLEADGVGLTMCNGEGSAGAEGILGASEEAQHHYDAGASQEALFEEFVKPLVDDLFVGISGAVLACGGQGSGRTHTIIGEYDDSQAWRWGALPRALDYIACIVDQSQASTDTRHVIHLEGAAVYQFVVLDLAVTDGIDTQPTLSVKSCPGPNPRIDGQRSVVVQSVDDMRSVLRGFLKTRDEVTRRFARQYTAKPSCVNSLFTVRLEAYKQLSQGHAQVRTSSLTFADFEAEVLHKPIGVPRAKPSLFQHVNLRALQQCANALCRKHSGTNCHIPLQDSPMTQLLAPSLGGPARLAVIGTCHPADTAQREVTLSTLRLISKLQKVGLTPAVAVPEHVSAASFAEAVGVMWHHDAKSEPSVP